MEVVEDQLQWWKRMGESEKMEEQTGEMVGGEIWWLLVWWQR